MTNHQVIESQDFSHPYTTDVQHVKDLYDTVVLNDYQKILELGSYKGISTVALALAAEETSGWVCSVDLCDEIQNAERVDYWTKYKVNHRIFPYKGSALDYLRDEDNPKYDFIFHDAAHGDSVLPELYLCWHKAVQAFAMHDFEQISDPDTFIKNINPRRWSKSPDKRGRELAIFYK